MDEPRTQRNRIHVDVVVPHDVADRGSPRQSPPAAGSSPIAPPGPSGSSPIPRATRPASARGRTATKRCVAVNRAQSPGRERGPRWPAKCVRSCGGSHAGFWAPTFSDSRMSAPRLAVGLSAPDPGPSSAHTPGERPMSSPRPDSHHRAMSTNEPEVVSLAPATTATIRDVVAIDELPAFFDRAFRDPARGDHRAGCRHHRPGLRPVPRPPVRHRRRRGRLHHRPGDRAVGRRRSRLAARGSGRSG